VSRCRFRLLQDPLDHVSVLDRRSGGGVAT
jgi:hypothetical protein